MSELLILLVLLRWSRKLLLFLMFGMYLSSMYRLYLFSYSQHGISSSLLNKLRVINVNNFLSLFLHFMPLNFLIIKMDIFFYLNSLKIKH